MRPLTKPHCLTCGHNDWHRSAWDYAPDHDAPNHGAPNYDAYYARTLRTLRWNWRFSLALCNVLTPPSVQTCMLRQIANHGCGHYCPDSDGVLAYRTHDLFEPLELELARRLEPIEVTRQRHDSK